MKHLMLATGILPAMLLGTAVASPALAQSQWPTAPVRIVVPFAAGGLADVVGRAFQASIQENNLLAQPMVIVNVGGHFSIGMRRVKDAAADGSEFLLGNVSIMAGEGSGVLDFGYRDFIPVAETGASCFIPVVRRDSGIADLAGLMDRAASGGDPVVVGVNIGANNHLAAAMLTAAKEGASFRYTQTGGDSASYTALIGDQIDLAFLSDSALSTYAMTAEGDLDPNSEIVPVAYMAEARNGDLPDLPTAIEQGFDTTFCIPMWWLAPAGTPAEAVEALADTLEEAAASERVQAFYADNMMQPTFARGAALQERLDALWADLEPVAATVIQAPAN